MKARTHAALVAAALAGPPTFGAAHAQSWQREASIEASVAGSSNGGQTGGSDAEADLITTVRPALHVKRRGPRLDFTLDAGASLLSYARGTQSDRILPSLRTSVASTLAERLLYLDASAGVSQVESNPYAGRVSNGSSGNRRTETNWRVAPYLHREFSDRLSVLARVDAGRSRQSGSDDEMTSRQSVVRLESRPAPWGYAVEASRLDLSSSGTTDEELSVEAVRLRGSALVAGELIVGPMVGREKTRLGSAERDDTLVGFRLLWEPSPRTRVFADVERAFYGTGGEISASHRTPSMSFLLRAARGPDALGDSGAAADLSAFLDAILTTRNPDPAQRSELVRDIVARRGLQTALPRAVRNVVGYTQLRTYVEGSWVLLGTRNTLALSVYSQRREQLAAELGAAQPLPDAAGDDRQSGGTVEFNRRLEPRLSVDVSGRWSRIRGLGSREGDESRESVVRVAFARELSPRTGATFGVQHRRVRTNVDDLPSFNEFRAFAGVSHRF